jgi:hypothetical protein
MDLSIEQLSNQKKKGHKSSYLTIAEIFIGIICALVSVIAYLFADKFIF